MGTTLSSGRWVLDFVNLRVYRDTSVTATVVDTVNDLYSDVQDFMDDAPNMDDTIPMSAQTPTEYSVINQWFIDDESPKYLKTGAIQTNGWESAPGASGNKYILAVRYDASGAGTMFAAADIGRTMVDVSGDTGEILGFDQRFGTELGIVYVRPDDPTFSTGDMFEVAGAFTVTGGTGAGITVDFDGSVDASGYGEQLWPNIFSIGTLVDDVRLYVIQGSRGIAGAAADSTKITSASLNGPYSWPAGIGLNADGHIDVLVKTRESLNVPYGGLTERDRGVISVFARRGGALYDHFDTDLTAGGRNPIPLSTGNDNLNDEIGHHRVTFVSGSGATLEVGELFQRNSPNTETAGVIAVHDDGGGDATGTIDYFLVRSLTQFGNTQACTATSSGKTFTTNSVPTDLTPVTDSAITINHTTFTRDINNGNGARPYSIDVDPATLNFDRVYRRFKYITRQGSTTTLDGDNGEEYQGSSLQIEYSGTGTFAEGEVVYGQTSLARGIVVANHDDGATGDLILRNINGTFVAAETVGDAPTAPTDTVTADSLRVISTPKASPLGTLAGGRLFGAPGVAFVIANIGAGDGSNYQLIDDDGVTQIPPTTVSVTVTGIVSGDRVAVFRTTAPGSNVINKAEYESHNTNNAAGDSTFETSGATIGNMHSTVGWIRVPYDTVNLLEDRYYYQSYATTTWTLDSIPDATVTTGDTLGLTLTATAADFVVDGVLPGMMVRNTSDGNSIGVVDTVVDGDNLTLEKRLAGGAENDFDIGDVIQINKLVRAYDNTDDVYVPFLDQKATGTSISTTIIYIADRDVVVRVRRGGVILPFEQLGTIVSSNFSVQAVRTLDTIAT